MLELLRAVDLDHQIIQNDTYFKSWNSSDFSKSSALSKDWTKHQSKLFRAFFISGMKALLEVVFSFFFSCGLALEDFPDTFLVLSSSSDQSWLGLASLMKVFFFDGDLLNTSLVELSSPESIVAVVCLERFSLDSQVQLTEQKRSLFFSGKQVSSLYLFWKESSKLPQKFQTF